MSGGRSDLSEQEGSRESAAPTGELNEALDRLRARIDDVAQWAEHASIPDAPPKGDASARLDEQELLEQPQVEQAPTPEQAPTAEPILAAADPVLSFLRKLVEVGAISGGVFTTDGDTIDLEPVESADEVPVSGAMALLDLVPPETVLEVRTTLAEWRAARIGTRAFALELRPGHDREVDEWLAGLLPPGKD